MGKILKCKKCGDIIQSKHRHDMVWCKCHSIAIDGGDDYFRWAGNKDDIEVYVPESEKDEQLAESEKKILELQEDSIRDNQIYNEQLAEQSDLIYHLKRQLNCDYYKPCPRCNNPYGSSQFPSKDENGKDIYVCSNCNEKELFYEPLIKQLEDQNDRLIKERDDANLKLSKLLQRVSEQNEELANRPTMEDLYPPQMIKLANQDKISFCIEQLEKVKCYAQHIQGGLINYIDNQIKQLKGGK